MYFRDDRYNEHYMASCPCCDGTGVVTKEKVLLRGELFKREDVEIDCFLCLGEQVIEVVDKKKVDHEQQVERDTPEVDFYSRGSSIFKEL